MDLHGLTLRRRGGILGGTMAEKQDELAMPPPDVDRMIARLRRHLGFLVGLRFVLTAAMLAAVVAVVAAGPEAESDLPMIIMMLFGVVWIALTVSGGRRAREVQLGAALVAVGDDETALPLLRDAMNRFTVLRSIKLTACHQLALIANRHGDHRTAVRLARTVLEHQRGLARWLANQARLLLADSLLMCNEVADAYAVFRPLYDQPLSLVERLALLPIQLRYELEAGHADAAVRALSEKVRLAELLDAPKAALVCALLAEACRRRDREADRDYLARRAALYHDLEPLARVHSVIAPVLEKQTP